MHAAAFALLFLTAIAALIGAAIYTTMATLKLDGAEHVRAAEIRRIRERT